MIMSELWSTPPRPAGRYWTRIRLKRLRNTANNKSQDSLNPPRDSNHNILNADQNNYTISDLRRTRGFTMNMVEQCICSQMLNLYDIFNVVFTVRSLWLWYLVCCVAWFHLKMAFHMKHVFLKLLAVFMTRMGACACCEGHARECWRSARDSRDVSVQITYTVLAIVGDAGGREVGR